MDSTKVDLFIASQGSKFPSESLGAIRDQLLSANDNTFSKIQTLAYKDPIVFFLISFFVGGLGVDRFMMGQTGLGILKLFTLGGMGIWALIDFIMAMGKAKKFNYDLLLKSL